MGAISSIFGFVNTYKGTLVNVLTVIAGTLAYLNSNTVVAQNPALVAGIATGVGVLNVVLHLFQEL